MVLCSILVIQIMDIILLLEKDKTNGSNLTMKKLRKRRITSIIRMHICYFTKVYDKLLSIKFKKCLRSKSFNKNETCFFFFLQLKIFILVSSSHFMLQLIDFLDFLGQPMQNSNKHLRRYFLILFILIIFCNKKPSFFFMFLHQQPAHEQAFLPLIFAFLQSNN